MLILFGFVSFFNLVHFHEGKTCRHNYVWNKKKTKILISQSFNPAGAIAMPGLRKYTWKEVDKKWRYL